MNIAAITEEALAYLCARVNITIGTRDDFRRFLMGKLLPLAPAQASLDFDVCANRHGGNPQSEEAQRRHGKRRMSQKKRVYLYIHERGSDGATCEEIEQALGLRHQTCSARVSDLKRDGLIRETGKKRMTSTGSPAGILGVT